MIELSLGLWSAAQPSVLAIQAPNVAFGVGVLGSPQAPGGVDGGGDAHVSVDSELVCVAFPRVSRSAGAFNVVIDGYNCGVPTLGCFRLRYSVGTVAPAPL